MANSLTGLIPTLYAALDKVSREQTGYLQAASRNSTAERAALNEPVAVPLTEPAGMEDNTPAVTAPDSGDQTIDSISMTITKSKHVPVRWNGEQQHGMLNAGTYGGVLQEQFEQAFRTLGNAIDADLSAAAYQNASRAYGTPGTAPFGTAGDLSDIAQVRKILEDNGSPTGDLNLVLGSAAIANLRGKQNVLFKVNESGTSELLRKGIIGELEGFNIRNSANVKLTAKGSGANYTTDAAGYAVGTKVINLITGTGTILAGDTIQFAGDTNKYAVTTGLSAPGTVTIGGPGLLNAIPGAATAVTVGASYTPNVALSSSALKLATRKPKLPIGPDGRAADMADDVMELMDPVTGIVYEVAVYRQFMQLVYHVRLAWGVAGIKPAHTALLLG